MSNMYDNMVAITSSINLKQIGGGYTEKAPKFINKTITENNTYTAKTDGADGYSSVTVDVSGGGPTPETFEVEFSITDLKNITANKTYDEALAAMNADKQLNAIFTTVPEGYTITMSGIPYKMHIKTNGEADYIVIPLQVAAQEQEVGMIMLWKEDNTIVMGSYD